MKAVAVGSLQVKLARLSAESGTPARRYDCCIDGIASTVLPDCSVSRRSPPLNQSSESTSAFGLKSAIVLFSFHAQVIVNVRGMAAVDTIAAGSGPTTGVAVVARSDAVADIIARCSSDSADK